MSLTLNQFLLLLITIAAVVAVTFLVTLFAQLKKTAKEGQETLKELRELVSHLKETNRKVNTKIDDLGPIVEASKNAAQSLSGLALFLSAKIIKPSSKYWPFLLPFIRLGWRHLRKKKRKEDKDGK